MRRAECGRARGRVSMRGCRAGPCSPHGGIPERVPRSSHDPLDTLVRNGSATAWRGVAVAGAAMCPARGGLLAEREPEPDPEPWPPPTASATATASPSASSGASTTPAASPTASASSAAVADCGPGDLTVTGGPWGGAAGSRGADVTVTAGATACRLPARPVVALADPTGKDLVHSTLPVTGDGPVLAAGSSRAFSFRVSNWCDAHRAAAAPGGGARRGRRDRDRRARDDGRPPAAVQRSRPARPRRDGRLAVGSGAGRPGWDWPEGGMSRVDAVCHS